MSADKDPLLVSALRRRAGNGVYLGSCPLGKEWVTWPGFPQWASQLARDTMRKFLN